MSDVAPPLSQGRYRLLAEIGRGGMATVYRGYDTNVRAYRAIKVLSPQYAANAAARKRFEREGLTMAQMQHPHVVTVYDYGVDTDLFIVMELMEGGSCRDWLRKNGPMPARLAFDVIRQATEAARYAHELRIVHRDIKPANILIGREGLVKLVDFGVAQVRNTLNRFTAANAVLGSWTFMAPEQRANPRDVDARADIYSLAASLYSLLTTEPPVDIVRDEQRQALLTLVDPVMHGVITRGTRFRAADRYPDCAALLEALAEVSAGLPEASTALGALAVPIEPGSLSTEPRDLSSDTFAHEDDDGETLVEWPVPPGSSLASADTLLRDPHPPKPGIDPNATTLLMQKKQEKARKAPLDHKPQHADDGVGLPAKFPARKTPAPRSRREVTPTRSWGVVQLFAVLSVLAAACAVFLLSVLVGLWLTS